jgi:hypothetical protein
MIDLLVVMVFGLPAVLLSLVLSVIGVWRDKFWLVILGAVLIIPFAYYLNGSPGLRGFAILLPLFQMVSGAAVREKSKVWAWILLIPAFLAGFWVLGVALYYQF